MTILQEALDLVDGERQEDYGPPRKMATRVSILALELFGIDLTPRQVIEFMMAMKLARLVETPDHRDSWVDLAGYIEVLDRVDGGVPEEILGEDFGSWEAPAGHGPVGMKYGEPTPQSRHAEVLTGDPTYRKPGTRD